jgi:hypothetical protein
LAKLSQQLSDISDVTQYYLLIQWLFLKYVEYAFWSWHSFKIKFQRLNIFSASGTKTRGAWVALYTRPFKGKHRTCGWVK